MEHEPAAAPAAARAAIPQLDAQPYGRMPPIFKKGHDFDLWLRRFEAYCMSMAVPNGSRVNLMINLLGDRALAMIERHITPQLTYQEICDHIRRAEGYDRQSTETFATALRHRMRTRDETMADFHLALYRLGQKAYPDSLELRNTTIRESFLANLGNPPISARLREHPELNMEQLLALAIRLHYCREASKTRNPHGTSANVNQDQEYDQANNATVYGPNSISAKLDKLIGLVSDLAIALNQNPDRNHQRMARDLSEGQSTSYDNQPQGGWSQGNDVEDDRYR